MPIPAGSASVWCSICRTRRRCAA
ncbi:hypothetical protein [Lawsonibacter hominis]